MSRIAGSSARMVVIALVSALAAMTLLSPTAASAAPRPPYPPGSPSLTVDRAVVKIGTTVRASGARFTSRTRVFVVASFKPANSNRSRVVKQGWVTTDRNGRFSISVKTAGVGQLTFRATANNTSASATVQINPKRGNSRDMRPAAFGVPIGETEPIDSTLPVIAVAGIGFLVAAGGTMLVSRRRRS